MRKRNRLEKVLIAVLIVLVLVLIFAFGTFNRSLAPFHQKEARFEQLARKQKYVKKTDRFYWFTRKKTYYTVSGETKDGQAKLIVFDAKKKVVADLNVKDGLDRNQVLKMFNEEHPKIVIDRLNFGMYDETPVWEITSKNTQGTFDYYLFSFKDGQELKVVKDI